MVPPLGASKMIWKNRVKYVFLLPSVISLVVVIGVPAIMTLVSSLTPPEGQADVLYNYKLLLQDQTFIQTFKNTFIFVFGTVVGHFVIGLPVALALNTAIKGRSLFRTLMILPWTIPDVISGIIWQYIYNPTSGFLNALLLKVGVIHGNIPWLGNPRLALFSVIFADIWRGYPYVMLVLLAGLQGIPKELYEAAKVDGASPIKEFLFITLPNLRRIFYIALALDTIWQFRRFGLIRAMTNGGPGRATEIISTWTYKNYFIFFKTHYAAAMAISAAIILGLFSILYIREATRE